jgi:hypothetical protein
LNTINGLEWDTYVLTFTDTTRDLAGSISPIPLSLAPGSTQNVQLIATAKNPDSLLVSVIEGGTNLALMGATVELTQGTTTLQSITGRGFLRQTDWSGVSGQNDFTDQTGYFVSDGNIDTSNPVGEIKLKNSAGMYAISGYLTSSSFDTGSASNFYQLNFSPVDQPLASGSNSVRLQIATNNDDSTWNFFGPDGTAASFYTSTSTNINSANNGNRYLRYKIYLATASSTFTPDVGEVNFTFTSNCVPSGQVLFQGLTGGDYDLSVSKDSYQTAALNVNISSAWQEQQITLNPE